LPARYTAELADADLKLPYVPEWAEPVWHLYVVQNPHRDTLLQQLHQVGIGTLIHYPIPPHLQQAYVGLGYTEDNFRSQNVWLGKY